MPFSELPPAADRALSEPELPAEADLPLSELPAEADLPLSEPPAEADLPELEALLELLPEADGLLVLLEDFERVVEPDRLLPVELGLVRVLDLEPELELEPDFLLLDFLRVVPEPLEREGAGGLGRGAAGAGVGRSEAALLPDEGEEEAVLTPARPPAAVADSDDDSPTAESHADRTALAGLKRFCTAPQPSSSRRLMS